MNGENLRPEAHAELFDGVNVIRTWLDNNAPEQTDSERVMMRVLKISEELGEVSEAVHGATGANPRKGESHTWADVEKELADVAVTALVALATVSPDARKSFDARLQTLVMRLTPPEVR
ncbi:MazG-like family protein [Streptomyces genisteinicus]|uniref:MazG-like family protein n=1 Tax=Streptomyces genisteinicus TaxID=2768068 RepID=A0A7H0HT04_9ACTN|nr:MazG-like family protein [Streptomyces genisteinicus]QNP63670.1 MazG-like family protein [Streptomyces genisteinicus]